MRLLLLAAVVVSARAFDLAQSTQSIKGGQHSFQYRGGDVTRFFNNGSSSHTSGGGGYGQAPSGNFEVGVCYMEVPTATLVRDPAHVPAGNGSRPDLSRIRTCCKGYTRNVYNHKICEPVCSQECVNALCTAPETCTCFPDHVRNLAGICVATCPIGCQNGHCSGGECLCKEGYKLDIDGRFCLPNCRLNCGGLGNCTAPNTCECNTGYRSTPDGSCQAIDRCTNGDFVRGQCRCHAGYARDTQGDCMPHCNQNCGPNGKCLAPNVCSMSPDAERLPPGQRPSPQNPAGGSGQNTYNFNSYNPYYPYPSSQNGSHPNQGTYQPNPSYPHNQGSNYPQYPNSQNGSQTNQGSYQPNPSYPHNQGSNYPQYPNSQNGSQTNQGPQPNPLYPYNQNHQYPYPQNSTNPQYNISYGTHHYPLTPGSQIGQNPQYNQPQYPYNPQNTQNPSNQASNPQYPSFQTINVTYPHPMYPDNQVGPYGPVNPSNVPGQPQYGQRSNATTDSQGGSPQYPSYQRPGYPTPQHGYYPANEPGNNYPSNQGGYYSNGYPSYQNYNPSQQNTFEVQETLCAEPCVNAVCIDHNRCRCNPGYITDENDPSGSRCRPHCPGGCLNGYCAAPHSCACDEGYYRDTSVKGHAVCVKRIR
ncbi:DNA-directed RNA polymerase II subunit RPB1-like [Ostrinia nubilalis]|uniref:DNA-directed RNA polymerase II subunit RPB1-like n=1 Tax=Ostrinia nubilalis TaxID=29057 RepID=UPI0030823BE4